MTLDLDALQAAAEAATPGPWEYTPRVLGLPSTTIMATGDLEHVCYPSIGSAAEANASFIAAWNPAVALEFVAAHRAALSRIARVEALHQSIVGECHTCSDENGPMTWPCPSARALTEGEPSE